MPRHTVKTSAIFIATGETTRVFRSLDEVPLPLRERLVASTSSVNSATILIADRRGRQELERALRQMPREERSPEESQPLAWTRTMAHHWSALATLALSLALMAWTLTLP